MGNTYYINTLEFPIRQEEILISFLFSVLLIFNKEIIPTLLFGTPVLFGTLEYLWYIQQEYEKY